MKLYIVVHPSKGKTWWYHLEAWADIVHPTDNSVTVKAVKAFTMKKYAKAWIEKTSNHHLVIKSIEVN